MPLRTSEWIIVGGFSWLLALGWWRRRTLDAQRFWKIVSIGVGGLAIALSASLLLPLVAPAASRIIRDLVPVLLITMFYWQAGRFADRSSPGFEDWLLRFDRRYTAPVLQWCARKPVGGAIFVYAEIAYASYYLAMPASLAALYLSGAGSQIDRYWTVVLLAAFLSCSTLPFLPTRPPRALGEMWSEGLYRNKMRAFNLFILRQGSIHTNTCPSAHVAITMACGLALLRIAPVSVGLIFLWVAVSVAWGAVAGRYHYAADAIFGAATAAIAFLAGMALG